MASLQLGATSLINGLTERLRFRVQQASDKEQRTKYELARSAKRSESLRYILKQYGISVENPEENKTSSCRLDEQNCQEHDAVLSSVIDDSNMNTTEELPDLRREETYLETVSTAENLSGQNQHKLLHLNTGDLFSFLLPILGFCIFCIVGILHRNLEKLNGSKKSQERNHGGSKTTRWRAVLSDWNEPFASEEHDSSQENRVGSADEEAEEAYRRVVLEYQRFLSECGVIES